MAKSYLLLETITEDKKVLQSLHTFFREDPRFEGCNEPIYEVEVDSNGYDQWAWSTDPRGGLLGVDKTNPKRFKVFYDSPTLHAEGYQVVGDYLAVTNYQSLGHELPCFTK